MTLLLVGLVLGVWLGYLVGVRRAEIGIARASGRRAMKGRSDWRK